MTIAALPWVSPARLVANMDGDIDRDRVNERAAELLVKVASELLMTGALDKPCILMLHGSVSGASLPNGLPVADLREPVIPLEELCDLGFEAIVASHIHVSQWAEDYGWQRVEGRELLDDHGGGPLVFYTGSPMPLNFGETGVAHGVWILDVDEATRAEFVPIESRPLFQFETELNDLPRADVGLDSLPEIGLAEVPEGAITKLRIRGTRAQLRRLDLTAVRRALLDEGAHTVKIETETIREDRARVDGVTEDLDPLEAFDAWAAANSVHPELAARVREQMVADLEAVGA